VHVPLSLEAQLEELQDALEELTAEEMGYADDDYDDYEPPCEEDDRMDDGWMDYIG